MKQDTVTVWYSFKPSTGSGVRIPEPHRRRDLLVSRDSLSNRQALEYDLTSQISSYWWDLWPHLSSKHSYNVMVLIYSELEAEKPFLELILSVEFQPKVTGLLVAFRSATLNELVMRGGE